jgi:hypothetical protein
MNRLPGMGQFIGSQTCALAACCAAIRPPPKPTRGADRHLKKRVLPIWFLCMASIALLNRPVYAEGRIQFLVSGIEEERASYESPAAIAASPVVAVAKKMTKVLHDLNIDAEVEAKIREKFEVSIRDAGWTVKSFSLSRFRIDRGMTVSIHVQFNTGDYCIENKTWIELLGRPIGLNLAEPFRYVNISTPEMVDRLINGHVAVLHYRLNENYRYSLESDEKSGCFYRLTIE